jgi:hypothetical protein
MAEIASHSDELIVTFTKPLGNQGDKVEKWTTGYISTPLGLVLTSRTLKTGIFVPWGRIVSIEPSTMMPAETLAFMMASRSNTNLQAYQEYTPRTGVTNA